MTTLTPQDREVEYRVRITAQVSDAPRLFVVGKPVTQPLTVSVVYTYHQREAQWGVVAVAHGPAVLYDGALGRQIIDWFWTRQFGMDTLSEAPQWVQDFVAINHPPETP